MKHTPSEKQHTSQNSGAKETHHGIGGMEDIKIYINEEATRVRKILREEWVKLSSDIRNIIDEDIATITKAGKELGNTITVISEEMQKELKDFARLMADPTLKRDIIITVFTTAGVVVLGSMLRGSVTENPDKIDTIANNTSTSAEQIPTEEDPGIFLAESTEVPLETTYNKKPEPKLIIDLSAQPIYKPEEIIQFTQKVRAPKYVWQDLTGQCGPASIAMLLDSLGTNTGIVLGMEEIEKELTERDALDISRGDIGIRAEDIKAYLEEKGFKVEIDKYKFWYLASVLDYFADRSKSPAIVRDENKIPVIVGINSTYTDSGDVDHLVLLAGFEKIGEVVYMIVYDPFRSAFKGNLLPGMIDRGDGSYLVPSYTWEMAAKGGAGIVIEPIDPDITDSVFAKKPSE